MVEELFHHQHQTCHSLVLESEPDPSHVHCKGVVPVPRQHRTSNWQGWPSLVSLTEGSCSREIYGAQCKLIFSAVVPTNMLGRYVVVSIIHSHVGGLLWKHCKHKSPMAQELVCAIRNKAVRDSTIVY